MSMHDAYMALALDEARRAFNEGEVPVGAVLVKDGEVICTSHNLREATGDPTAHAEILCMRRGAELLGDWRLRGCTLYVTLEPCPMCAGAMTQCQLDTVVFGAADPRMGCCGSVYDLPQDPALSAGTRWISGVMADDCRALLTGFFEGLRGQK